MHAGEAIIPIVFFLVVFGIFYLYLSSRNKERLALIEKGAEATIFYGPKTARSGKWVMQVGVLAIGIALGVLVGAGLESAGLDDDVAFPASIFLFAGIALVVSYFLARKVNGSN